jgi:hypothetical protein
MALTPEQEALNFNPELQDVSRQQKLAELLMAQGMQGQPQGQMISGHYVAPSFTQQLTPIANVLAGQAVGERADIKQKEIAAALRGKREDIQQQISDAIKSGDTKTALAIASKNPEYAKEYIAPLIGNIVPKAPEIMSEKDKEEIRIKDMQNKIAEAHYKQMAAQQQQSLMQSRVPMGYRMTSSGGLEAIPGGPADLKLQMKQAGANDVDLAVSTLRDKYMKLNELNAIHNTEKSAYENLKAGASSSGIGQTIANALGTEAASARNSIAMERPKLLAAIQKATGMSAKQIDSNAELKLWLTAATDPTKDFASNMEALDNIEKSIGSLSIQGSQSAGGLPTNSEIDAEMARRKKK